MEEIDSPIGIGTPITERPSHSTGHTDRVSAVPSSPSAMPGHVG